MERTRDGFSKALSRNKADKEKRGYHKISRYGQVSRVKENNTMMRIWIIQKYHLRFFHARIKEAIQQNKKDKERDSDNICPAHPAIVHHDISMYIENIRKYLKMIVSIRRSKENTRNHVLRQWIYFWRRTIGTGSLPAIL